MRPPLTLLNRLGARLQPRMLGVALAAALNGLLAPAHAGDPAATKISLPDGPGSIEGLGRNFEPSLASGTASYGVELKLPPAVGGFAPKLSLDYDSGGGASEVGIGWKVGGVPCIRRRVHDGLPRFDETDAFEIAGIGLPSDLLELAPGLYRPEHESGDFARVKRSDDGATWEVRAKDGTTYRFGGEGYTEAEGDHVATYLLREQLDLHGHAVSYEWETTGGYALLTRVTLNAHVESATIAADFYYETRPDPHLLYSSGIERRLGERLASVEVTRGGELVRRYTLGYADADGHSHLARVELVGADETTALPTLSFDYTEPSFAADGQLTTMVTPPGRTPADADVQLADLNGDSLPDLLVGQPGAFRSYVNHDGTSWLPGADWSAAASPSVALGSTGVQLADLDGNGALDLVIKSGTTSFRYLPGLDATTFATAVPIATVPNFTFEDPDVRLADMDGDRRTDVVITTAAGLAIGYNLDGQDFTVPETIGEIDPAQPLRFSDGHTQLCDVNGDGVQDFCYLRSEGLLYWLGRGRGVFEAAAEATGVPSFEATDPWQLVDLNGDGWVDLLHVGVTRVEFALAEGLAAFGVVQEITGTPENGPDLHVELSDLNGSGTTDIVWIDVTGTAAGSWQYLELFPEGRSGLLQRIDNGLGKVVTIEYEPAALSAARARDAGEPWTTRMNVGMPVVRRVAVDASLGDPELVTEYDYQDGTWDPSERTFAGFAGGRQEELGDASTPTLVTETTFDTGLAHRVLRGQVLTTESRTAAGLVFTRATNTYLTPLLEVAADGRQVEYGYRDSELVEHVEGQAETAARRVLTEWEQDDFGNVIRESKWGEVVADEPLAGQDEVITVRTYANNEEDWILGKVATERVEDGAGTRVAEKRTYYDGEPFEGLPLREVARGDVRRVESWIEGDTWADEAAYEHDEHGNVTTSRNARGGKSEYEYDDSFTFVEAERQYPSADADPLTWSATYDPRFGTVTEMTGPNGERTLARYDALGRVTKIIKPGDTEDLPTEAYEYTLASPLSHIRAEQREVSGEAGTLTKVSYVDGLSRARGTLAEAATEGRFILSDFITYDARGNKAFTAYPSEERSADLPDAATASDRPGTATLFDATGRALSTVHPDGASTRVEHLPLARTEWDENDNDPDSRHHDTPTTYRNDGQGRLVAVVERTRDPDDPTAAPRELTTGAYTYDPLGKVLTITDAAGTARAYRYDGRSRRTQIDDPNAGTWTLEYTAGNDLARRLDPAGHALRYEYDDLGRPLGEWHTLADGDETRVTTYHYDAPAQDHASYGNTRARLGWVEDAAGAVYFAYSDRGLITTRTRRWTDGTEHTTTNAFDAADRPTQRGYPDRSTLALTYDSRGLLAALGPVAPEITWTADGKLSGMTLGNGVTDLRHYDDRQRLERLEARDAADTALRDLTLTLDAASRITEVEDLRPDVPAASDLTARYDYDDRYRLITATDKVGATTWTYDDVANIRKVTSTHDAPWLNVENTFGEDGAGPDQMTHFGDEALSYDAGGRVTQDGERVLTWDAKGRLTKVERGDVTEEYVYDYSDTRAVKRTTTDGNTEVVRYIDKDAEERDGNLVRYVFFQDQRLARLDALSGEAQGALEPGAVPPPAGTGWTLPPLPGAWRLLPLWLGLAALLVAVAWGRRVEAFAHHLSDLLRAHPLRGPPLVGDRRVWRWGAVFAVVAAMAPGCKCGSDGGKSDAKPITELPADAVLYLADFQGSPLITTNALGAVTKETAYHPYGSVRSERGDEADPWSFVGNEADTGSGLGDFRARAYRAEAGVFLSPDPVGVFVIDMDGVSAREAQPAVTQPAEKPPSRLGSGRNLYAYSSGDPVCRLDPSGMDDDGWGSWNIPGKVWAGANPIGAVSLGLGVGVGVAGWAFGGEAPRIDNNAIEFRGNPFIGTFTPAVTLGNVILYEDAMPYQDTIDHERQHTYQAETLGPLYIPANVVGQAAGYASSWFDSSQTYTSTNDRVHGPWNFMESGPDKDPRAPW